ncbi:MAG: cytidine deaminase [Aerococcaceae bacterium]|nr:cytidine deaminase [Aerococcaceae bacterium]
MDKQLIQAALEARKAAYTPYSNFKVGAALLAKSGKIYKGCNIENASYTPTNCAERTAFFKAVSEGDYGFEAICVVGGAGEEVTELVAPCGVCRQVMMEFCDPETFRVIVAVNEDHYVEMRLNEFLPMGFGPKNLKEHTHD